MATIQINKVKKRFFIVLIALVMVFSTIQILNSVRNKKSLCKDCNIIMISIDSLSANHMPCYGYDRDTTPNLCKFGSNNIIFKNAFSNATWTLPSHVSMFTSLYPEYHNVIKHGDVLSLKIPFLPEILQNNGYETFFYIPKHDYTLPINDVYSRGITKIIPKETINPNNPFSYLNDALNSFLSNIKKGEKTFTFLHTYYVHNPYLIEEREKIYTKDSFDNIPLSMKELFDRPFTSELYQEILSEASLKKNTGDWREVSLNFYDNLKNAKTLEEAEKIFKSQGEGFFWYLYYVDHYYMRKINKNDKLQVEYIKALYDQEIHELDEWIGNVLIPFLEYPAIKNNTIVIITSDHGEEFMEHDQIGHTTAYDSNLKIPFLIYIPGITGKTIMPSVQSIDIVPTILDIIGISSNKFLFQGYSLVDLIQKNTKINRLLFADGFENKTKAIRKENWKLFLMKDMENKYVPYELYDTESDPNELNNILSSHMDIVNRIINENDAYNQQWRHLLPFIDQEENLSQ